MEDNKLALIADMKELSLPAEESKFIDAEIERTVLAHRGNRQAINRLTMECIANLTEAENSRNRLSQKGFWGRLWGSLNGDNLRLEKEIANYNQMARYASLHTLQKLAEQNALTFDLLSAVNTKLNASLTRIDAEFSHIYAGLKQFVRYNQGQLVAINTRLDKLEQDVRVLNWLNSIEYQLFEGREYAELSEVEKLVCLASDFYRLTGGNWQTADLLLLKRALTSVGLETKKKVNYLDMVQTIGKEPKLLKRLFGEEIQFTNKINTEYLLFLSSLQKTTALQDREAYIVDACQEMNGQFSVEEIEKSLLQAFMKREANVDLNVEIDYYNLLLDMLFNIQQGFAEHGIVLCSEALIKQFNEAEQGLYTGNIYHEESGILQCQDIRTELFLQLAERGDLQAQYVLGLCYQYGLGGLEKDYELAKRYFKQAAELDNASAQSGLARMYLNGIGVKQDDKMALLWFEKAVTQELASAQNTLGWMYNTGRGVEEDLVQAVEWYRKSAEQGNVVAQNNLGNMYRDGKGVSQDDKEAVEWYRKSAEQNYSDGQLNLGWMYERGRGVDQSDIEAVEWYRKSAEQGNAMAQNNLGFMYQYGRGISQDYEKAVEWYRKAVKQGNINAQGNLGYMYHHGTGVAMDYVKAFELYRCAAEQGSNWSQAQLAYMYQYGYGVTANSEIAKKWYRKAAENGNNWAKDKLKNDFNIIL